MNTRLAAVAFMDVVGSVQISYGMSPGEYEKRFIEPLHGCYRSVLKTFRLMPKKRERVMQLNDVYPYEGTRDYREMDIRGDQMVVILCSNDPARDVEHAARIALEAAERWLLRLPNIDRWRQSMEPLRVVAGVHLGPLVVRTRSFGLRPNARAAEGYAINYAKRVEAHARDGCFTRVMLSENAWVRLSQRPDAQFVTAEPQRYELKGIGCQPLREVKYYLSSGVFTPPVRDIYARMFSTGVHNVGSALALLNHMRYAGESGLDISRQVLWSNIEGAARDCQAVRDFIKRKIRKYDAKKAKTREMPKPRDPVPDEFRMNPARDPGGLRSPQIAVAQTVRRRS